MPRTFRFALVVLDRDGFDGDDDRASSGSRARRLPADAGAAGPAAARPASTSGLNDVVATVTVGNQTDKVTKGEVIELSEPLSALRRRPRSHLPPGHRLSWSTPSFS